MKKSQDFHSRFSHRGDKLFIIAAKKCLDSDQTINLRFAGNTKYPL
jgi:hypothetical protein